MKVLYAVKSNVKPVEVDDFSSDTTVFERKNITESKFVDPVFHTEETFYVYDEYQYSVTEWDRIIIKQLINRVEYLEGQVKKLSEEK